MNRVNHKFNCVLRKAWKYDGKGTFNKDEKVILSYLADLKYVTNDDYHRITSLGISYLHTVRHEFITMLLPLGVSILSLAISTILLLKELNLLGLQ